MSTKARVQYAAQWLPVVLFLGFVAVAAVAVDTNATAASKIPVVENIAAGIAPPASPARHAPVQRPIVIAALAARAAAAPAPATTPPLRSTIAPLISDTPLPTPGHARFFTVNEVLAKHAGRTSQGKIQLASVDPTATPNYSATHDKSDEPFGLFTFVAPDNLVWFKWRKVAAEIRAEESALLHCLSNATSCSPGAARFVAIVKEAREHGGRMRLNFVNQRVNNAIRYTSDMTQWATADEWSAPLAGGKGSFETGMGDCEDYAIAKYVALRAAGIPAKQLRVLLVHDNIARLDHAVLAANEEGRWFILDNRWTAAIEDTDVRRFTPLFALDDQGVKLLLVPYASRVEPKIEPMSEAIKDGKQKRAPGEESADSAHFAPSINTLGLRPSII